MASFTVNGQLLLVDNKVTFAPPPSQKFRIAPFASREDAISICNLLMTNRQSSIARVYPVMTVNDEQSYYVAWELLGSQLFEIPQAHFVLQRHRISEFYQELLNILFSIMKYMMENNVSWTYDMSDIYVSNDDNRISLVGFTRGARDLVAHCTDLAVLIKAINAHCHYDSGTNTEMSTLLSSLSLRLGDWKMKIRRLPLFFSPFDRRELIIRVADVVKMNSRRALDDSSSLFPKGFSVVVERLLAHPDVIALQNNSDAYEGDDSKFNHTKLDTLILMRNCLAHFYSNRLEYMHGEEDMIALFENVAPNLFTNLVEIGKTVECYAVGIVIPKKEYLEDLFG